MNQPNPSPPSDAVASAPSAYPPVADVVTQPKFTLAWAVCPACGESWTSDIDPDESWVIREVVDECRAHLAVTEHSQTFDVGIEP